MKFGSMIFCECGSELVDVYGHTSEGARFQCARCHRSAVVKGFTLGRTEVSDEAFAGAKSDRAIRRE